MAIMNYDPNLVFCGRMAKQTVRLTFGIWKYRKTVEVTIGGNCRGLNVIDAAVESYYDQLPDTEHASDCKRIFLQDENGSELESSDDEGEEEEFLKNMLISAEIIDIQPEKS